jgi:D-glycero-D-manno-heptose 1,7-bisphosphate phosphatase
MNCIRYYHRHQALFLDRDGVINADYGYVYRADQVCFIEGIFELCRHAHSLGYLIIVVTNQAGIGRGYYTQSDFEKLMNWMKAVFVKEGCPITDVYWCPNHPTAGTGKYKSDSFWRKPNPGMILAAAQKYKLDLAHSVLIGDKVSDISAGLSAGIHCNLLYCADSESRLIRQSLSSNSINKITDAKTYLDEYVYT